MADETKKITKFIYNPESLGDICEFSLVFDHLHWKLLCKQAIDTNTTPSHLLAMIVETYLVKTGYLDPKAPSVEGYPVAVTLREIRDNPSNLFKLRKNSLFSGKEDSDGEKGSGLSADDLDYN